MSLLEKIIFVSDYLEIGRSVANRQMLTELAVNSLDKAVCYIAKDKIKFLLDQNKSIYSKLLDCYNFYLNNLG